MDRTILRGTSFPNVILILSPKVASYLTNENKARLRTKDKNLSLTVFLGSYQFSLQKVSRQRGYHRVIRCASGMAICLPHDAVSRVACRRACKLISLIFSTIGWCRLIKKWQKSPGRSIGRPLCTNKLSIDVGLYDRTILGRDTTIWKSGIWWCKNLSKWSS